MLNKRKDSKYEVTKIEEKTKPRTVPKAGTSLDGKTDPAAKTPEKEPAGKKPEGDEPAKGAGATGKNGAEADKTGAKKPEGK